jgi:hypothetical protein
VSSPLILFLRFAMPLKKISGADLPSALEACACSSSFFEFQAVGVLIGLSSTSSKSLAPPIHSTYAVMTLAITGITIKIPATDTKYGGTSCPNKLIAASH